MMASGTRTPPTTVSHHLLGHPSDLTGHLVTHGPLEVSLGSATSWRQALAANLEAAGLVGRGGGAFPVSIKLALARSNGRGGGTVVVNGMEGEPASDKDKLLLATAPNLVLDGAQYLAALCRSSQIVVCVPSGRDRIAAAVHLAISERKTAGYSRVSEVVARPPDRFVAGEESALVNWLSDGEARPVFRPDKRIPLRIGKTSALVHNAETLAHVALIARNGPGPFRSRGLNEDPGPCLVTISGAVDQPGVVEVDRGTTLWDIAALSAPAESIQAMLVGGYGGAWVGPEHFRTPYAAGPLRSIGATAGVGVIVVLGSTSCGIAESARIAGYLAEQGAGQCGPCVFGLPAIAADLAHLAHGRVDPRLPARLERRLSDVIGRGACRHPDGAVGMVRSALTVFSSDRVAHGRGDPCRYSRQPTVLRFPRPWTLV